MHGHLRFAPTEKAVYIVVPKGLRNGTRIIMPLMYNVHAPIVFALCLPGKIQNLAATFTKKNLTQKSGQINKVHWQFFTYPENFR